MGFNLNNIASIVKIARTIRNPEEAKNMLLNKIAEKNPQMAQGLKVAMQSGKKPAQVLKENVANGTISANNLAEVKKGYKMAQSLGLTQKVPDSVWQELDAAVKNGNSNNNNSFAGF